jgi:glycosyltransferase involved in cell wall biosynthesis
MKLLLYSHFFAPSVGGVETIALSLAEGLASIRDEFSRRQFEVTVVTETPAGAFDDKSTAFTIVRQPSLRKLGHLIRAADAVHLAGPSLPPLLLARIAHKPCVVEHHGYQTVCLNGVLLYQCDGSICPGHFQAGRYANCLKCQATAMSWTKSLVKLLLMFPRYFLTCKAERNIAITKHVSDRLRLPNSSVVYYGVEDFGAPEPKLVDLRAATETIPPGTETFMFAYVGRLVPEKGLLVLLAAAEIVMRERLEFKVLLVGDGPERPRLENAIDKMRLRGVVGITGFLQGPALASVVNQVRVVVMPSVWEETAGLSAIEQMMRGRLVIAPRIGGLGEVVADAGLTCLPGDAEDLARCMREVLRNPSVVDTFGRKARQRARSFFLRERMIADHARIYLELAHRKPRD